MLRKFPFRSLAVATSLALLIVLAVVAPGASADGGEDGQAVVLEEVEKKDLKYPNLGSHLDELVARVEDGEMSEREAAGEAAIHQEELVAVTIYLTGNVDEVLEFLIVNGGDPRNVGEDYIEAYVPVALLGSLSDQPGVIRVREIVPPEPDYGPITSEGVQAHATAAWHQAGITGQGIKVGILDSFEGFRNLMGTELPSTVISRCYTDVGRFSQNLADCDVDSAHGTAVAEAIMDIAPGVSLYIANPVTSGDRQEAARWMTSQGVSVINQSGSYPFQGPGDGKSPFSWSSLRTIDQTVANGSIWINSAGNYNQQTWFSKSPSLYTPSTTNNTFVAFDGSEDFINGLRGLGGNVQVQLRWDDTWGGASSDLDLGLFDFTLGRYVAGSADDQTGLRGHIPTELLSHQLIRNRLYGIVVQHSEGGVPDWVQVITRGSVAGIEYYTEGYSINNASESANDGMLAVGAAHYWDTHTIAEYSSRGPTPDGRDKPDIVGTDCAETASYEHYLRDGQDCWFSGTSQAASHVAGLAALVRQRFPDYTPQQTAAYLKDNAQRRGTVPNNTWGYGFAQLPPPDGVAPPRPPTTPVPSDAFSRKPAADFNTLTDAFNWTPAGIWSDGTTMWVADWIDNKIYAYDMATRGRVPGRDFDTLKAAGNTWPEGIWSDGTTMWVAGSSAGSFDDKIYAYDVATKARVPGKDFDTLQAAGNSVPGGIWSDGTTMWVTDWIDDKIYAYDMATKARVPGKDFDTLDAAGNEDPEGIWSDGETMWVVDDNRDKIYAYDMATKARVHDKEFNTLEAASNTQPEGIWSDGTTMWVADWIDNKIYAYHMPPPATPVPPAGSCVETLRFDETTNGQWTTDCDSVNQPDSYGRYYTFVLSQESEVTITLESDVDTYLFLLEGHGDSGALLYKDDDYSGGGRNSRIEETLDAGSYTVEATTYEAGQTGSFALAVELAQGPGQPGAACMQSVGVDGGAVSGIWAGDCPSVSKEESYARYYTLSLPEESEVSITLESDDADTYLFLLRGHGTSGAFLYKNDDYSGGERNSRILETLEAGSYTVEATTYKAEQTGGFTLTVDTVEEEPGSPGPPGPPVTTGCVETVERDGTVSGQWAEGCESENQTGSYAQYYSFTLVQRSEVTITLERTSGDADTYLNLLSGAGRDGSVLHSNDDDGGTARSRIQETLEAGTYTVEATTYEAGQTGSFTLTVSGLGDGATPVATGCVETLEEDGTRSGSWAAGCDSAVSERGYARYYTFTLAQQSEVTITLESSDADAYLYLRDDDARSGEPRHEDDDGAGRPNSRIQETLPAGAYTIEATTYDPGETGGFTLTVSGL